MKKNVNSTTSRDRKLHESLCIKETQGHGYHILKLFPKIKAPEDSKCGLLGYDAT
jgi:hypothetical protein